MKNNKTREIVLAALLTAMALVLGVIEIPYPFAPWLQFDLSEVIILMAISLLSLRYTIFIIFAKFMVSIFIKGPVGPLAIGQISALIASLSIALSYYCFMKIIPFRKQIIKKGIALVCSMSVFALVMFIINYYFVTPTYLMNQPTWYTQLPYILDIDAFNSVYGTNMTVPAILSGLSAYGQAIFIIYFPFNFLKGMICGIVYMFVSPVEKYWKTK